jgi:hypothetical protein
VTLGGQGPESAHVGLRLYPELDKQLDAWLAKQDEAPSRPEAIRRLLTQALSGKTGKK